MTKQTSGGVRKRGLGWWLRYTVDGVRYQESAATGDERAARSLLAQRRREIVDGTWKAPGERAGLARVEEARAELARALDAAPDAKPITVGEYLDAWTKRRAENGVRHARNEATYFARYVKPEIGARPLAEVTRTHVRDLVAKLATVKSDKTGTTLSPRTVIHVYRALSCAFADAVLEEVIAASPCTLKTRKGELPRKRDKDPTWRASAVYTRDEIEVLLADDRVPLDRRAFYALMALGGLRTSEAAGRRWRDYDVTAKPLGRLVVATQADGATGSRETKTGDTREVPVVPALAAILAEWKLSGFPLLFGRHAQPDDPIVPSRGDLKHGASFRSRAGTFDRLRDDLATLELRRVPSLQHAMRATFLSLLEVDGANMGIARRATHAAPSDVVGGYIRVQWADLCREIGKLNVRPRKGAKVITLPVATTIASDPEGANVWAISGAISRTEAPRPLENRPRKMGVAGLEPATSTV